MLKNLVEMYFLPIIMNRKAVDFTTFEGCLVTVENLIKQDHPAIKEHTLRTISDCLILNMTELLDEARTKRKVSLEVQEERRKYISLILGSFSIIYPAHISLLGKSIG